MLYEHKSVEWKQAFVTLYLQNGSCPSGATVVMINVVRSSLGVFAFLPAWWKAWRGQGVGGRRRLNRVKQHMSLYSKRVKEQGKLGHTKICLSSFHCSRTDCDTGVIFLCEALLTDMIFNMMSVEKTVHSKLEYWHIFHKHKYRTLKNTTQKNHTPHKMTCYNVTNTFEMHPINVQVWFVRWRWTSCDVNWILRMSYFIVILSTKKKKGRNWKVK